MTILRWYETRRRVSMRRALRAGASRQVNTRSHGGLHVTLAADTTRQRLTSARNTSFSVVLLRKRVAS